MDVAQKVFQMVLIMNNKATEISRPGEQSLDFVTSAVSPRPAPVLCRRLFSVALLGRDRLYSGRRRLLVQRVAVVRLVSDLPLRGLPDEAFEESVRDEGDFMRRSGRRVNSERKTSAICHRHELRAFAPLSLSHSEPPFLTTTNIPPMKNSLRSRWPCAQRSSASASGTLRKTPSRTQGLNPRWQVWHGGKRSGMSSRRAPLLKTQRAPLVTLPAFFPCDRPGRLGIQRSKSETTGLQPASRKIFQKQ
jgi:hypothetical protein